MNCEDWTAWILETGRRRVELEGKEKLTDDELDELDVITEEMGGVVRD